MDLGVQQTHTPSSAVSRVQEDQVNEAWQLYLAEHPYSCTYMPSPPPSIKDDLLDPPGILSLGLTVCLSALHERPLHERWDVDKESLGFLASTLALAKDESDDFLDLCGTPYANLKIMEPVLSCDPEADLWRVRRRNEVHISMDGMEAFELDHEKGESWRWPGSQVALPALMDQLVSFGKLQVDQDVAAYLRDIIEPATVDDELYIANTRVKRLLTPPLMPLSPPCSSPRLSADLTLLDLTSTPEDLLAAEAERIETQILAADAAISLGEQPERSASIDDAEPGHFASFLDTPNFSSSSPLRPTTWQQLKAEAPLIPPSPEVVYKDQSRVTLSEPLVPLLGSELSVLDPKATNDDLGTDLQEIVIPFAASAIIQMQNEQLSEFDTTMRVPVPGIDRILPVAPWEVFKHSDSSVSTLKDHMALLAITKRELLSGESPWPGVSRLERQLPWSPFPARLGKIDVEEDFNDGSAEQYMAELDVTDEIDVEALIARSSQLRLLSSEDSDLDELEPAVIEDDEVVALVLAATQPLTSPKAKASDSRREVEHGPPVQDTLSGPGTLDLQTLVRKRKLELERGQPSSGLQEFPSKSQKLEQGGLRPGWAHDLQPTRLGDLRGRGITSFLQLQGVPDPVVSATKCEVKLSRSKLVASQAVMLPTPHSNDPPPPLEHQQPALPTPSIPMLDGIPQIIVSAHLLATRTLIRQLHTLIPNLDIIERDNMPTANPLTTGNAAPKLSISNNDEADITLSPSTGLLLTTIQTVKQKPLPGQPPTHFTSVRERIARSSLRYEHLFVLVAAATSSFPSQHMDCHDAAALMDLHTLAAGLEADVQVLYVAGGETETAKWTAALVARHATPSGPRLLQEETLWERFLRRADMNAFAAQAVLGALKKCQGSDGEMGMREESAGHAEKGAHGLAAFVIMSAEERVRRLGPVLGGERVLRRAGGCIDGGWVT